MKVKVVIFNSIYFELKKNQFISCASSINVIIPMLFCNCFPSKLIILYQIILCSVVKLVRGGKKDTTIGEVSFLNSEMN